MGHCAWEKRVGHQHLRNPELFWDPRDPSLPQKGDLSSLSSGADCARRAGLRVGPRNHAAWGQTELWPDASADPPVSGLHPIRASLRLPLRASLAPLCRGLPGLQDAVFQPVFMTLRAWHPSKRRGTQPGIGGPDEPAKSRRAGEALSWTQTLEKTS